MSALASPRRVFADLPANPAEHFQLAYFAAVSHLIEQVAVHYGSLEAAEEAFPFLSGYLDEIARYGLPMPLGPAWWQEALRGLEARAGGRLPLAILAQAADLDPAELSLFMAVGLTEEDPRFGLLFETLQISQGQHRPTVGLLTAWWRGLLDDPRASLRRLKTLGLIQLVNPDAPRLEWALQVPGALWDAVRGGTFESPDPGLGYLPHAALPPLRSLPWPVSLEGALERLPELLRNGQVGTLVVRGAARNGRKTLVGGLAATLGLGLLEARGPDPLARWNGVGPLASVLEALPLLRLELPPGETARVPRPPAYRGPLAIVLGPQGGLDGPALERALGVTLDLPTADERRLLWQRALGGASADHEAFSRAFRLSRGHVARSAEALRVQVALNRHRHPSLEDLREAVRLVGRQALEGLASPLETAGDWHQLAVSDATRLELDLLERRIRQRERLPQILDRGLHAAGVGVRALFTGPSGTGKTLAARLLAGVLGKDLYRLDLAGVVNKYIGETEKNLERTFARAEELDVILLLDEGDALLTARTDVHNANDRYANLETNYLLQRLESFDGILLVTTNAASRIDGAFQRRMDVVVEFRAPDAQERSAIWRLHLPADPTVGEPFLQQVAQRCALSGGQIKNAVLHAALLALEAAEPVGEAHLERALQREYHKLGQVCPLRR